MKLSLQFTIRAELAVEPSYLSIRPDKKGNSGISLKLTTQKKDLVIESVSFKEHKKTGKAMDAWQTALPMPLNFKLEQTDTKLEDGYIEYSMEISTSVPEDHKTTYGNFILKTNHPKKKEVELRGVIMEIKK